MVRDLLTDPSPVVSKTRCCQEQTVLTFFYLPLFLSCTPNDQCIFYIYTDPGHAQPYPGVSSIVPRAF